MIGRSRSHVVGRRRVRAGATTGRLVAVGPVASDPAGVAGVVGVVATKRAGMSTRSGGRVLHSAHVG